jgi:hypothetical protein
VENDQWAYQLVREMAKQGDHASKRDPALGDMIAVPRADYDALIQAVLAPNTLITPDNTLLIDIVKAWEE